MTHKKFLFGYVLCCLSLWPSAGRAQLKLGLGAGYERARVETFNEAIRYFNLSHPTLNHNFIDDGVYLQTNFSFRVYKQFFLTTRFNYHQMSAAVDDYVYDWSTSLHQYNVSLAGDVYPFKFSRRRKGGGRYLFLSAFGGASYLLPEIMQDNNTLTFGGEPYDPSTILPYVGLGLGYDLFTLNKVSITPEIRASYYFPFGFENLSHVYSQSQLIGQDKTAPLMQVQGGIQLRYHSRGRR